MADEPQAERDVVEPDVAETESEPESDVPSEEPESPLALEAEVAADYLAELLDIADLTATSTPISKATEPTSRSSANLGFWLVLTVRSWTRCRN